jgi:hypothetical protein
MEGAREAGDVWTGIVDQRFRNWRCERILVVLKV